MKYTCAKFSHSTKQISICDSQIDAIICSDNNVRFVFSKGFFVCSGDTHTMCSCGFVELSNCDADEFDCHIVHREPTPVGARLVGTPISLIELASILEHEERRIEVFLELYDFNYLYWRGTLLPHSAQGLSDNVVIEISGCFPMSFGWK